MVALNENHLVGEDGRLRPQGVGGTTASVSLGLCVTGSLRVIITSSQCPRNIIQTPARFFTTVEEMRFAMHEMFEVLGLSMGDLPYEEYISGTDELDDAPQVYETYY